MNAYNYDTQKWVDGDDALAVRIDQIKADIACMTGPRAKEFSRFCGLNACEALERLAQLQCELEQLLVKEHQGIS